MSLPPAERLTRDDWIAAARKALIKGGVAAIKVDHLARQIGVTRGSFYWHFRDRNELLKSLLQTWKQSDPFRRVTQQHAGKPVYQLAEFFCIWLRPGEFDPDYDAAVRDWARVSAAAAQLVRQVDETRLETLRALFQALGFPRLEADIRARVMYYHQVGYFALRLRETLDNRRSAFPTYFKVLVGASVPREYLDDTGALALSATRPARRAAG
ncbi:MAG: TetR/AcrR family transcriptional regulator [Rhodospirillales bacterium]|nr:TetR/AcrR family transcriptional regulator [Rhodospirillales bacterium]